MYYVVSKRHIHVMYILPFLEMNIKEKECVTNISLEVIWAMPERKGFSCKRSSLITERLFCLVSHSIVSHCKNDPGWAWWQLVYMHSMANTRNMHGHVSKSHVSCSISHGMHVLYITCHQAQPGSFLQCDTMLCDTRQKKAFSNYRGKRKFFSIITLGSGSMIWTKMPHPPTPRKM